MASRPDREIDGGHFEILEKFGEKIECLENELMDDPTVRTLQQIYNLKREIVSLRKSVGPLRELISGLERSESALIEESTGVYLRDVYDLSSSPVSRGCLLMSEGDGTVFIGF